MIVAMNEKGQLVKAKEMPEKNVKTKFWCPACQSQVILKNGKIRIPHFSHLSTIDCESFSEGESEEHLMGKELLYQFFQEKKIKVEMEWYLPVLKQRPDLYLPDHRLAIEFQCSSISYEKLKERSHGYRSIGIEVVWIVGKNFYIKKPSIRPSQKLYIQDLKMGRPYFLQLDAKQQVLTIVLSFNNEMKRSTIVCTLKTLAKGNNLNDIIQRIRTSTQSKVGQTDRVKRHLQLHRERARQSGFFYRTLYENKETITSLPIECYVLVRNEWAIHLKSIEWKFYVLLWIERRNKGHIFTLENLIKGIEDILQGEDYLFEQIPLIEERHKLLPFRLFLFILEKKGIIRAISPMEWVYLKPANRFSQEEEKLEKLKDDTYKAIEY